MKATSRYIRFGIVWCLLMATIACHEDAGNPLLPMEEEGALVMRFQLTPAAVSRSGDGGAVDLFYTVEDNVLNPCDAPANWPMSRALGDGNVADGGGMADLTVFLVDANDRIVERQSLSALSDPTMQEITFRQLRLGTYTVYAYANTVGNDWFAMPTESETSFANYKDAKLKLLNGTVPPVIANGRMPLTGKKEISVSFGENSETIEMIRPVGKLSVSVINNREEAIELTSLSLGNIFPSTGYVFPHETILPQNNLSNPYHALPNLNMTSTVLPKIKYDIYESLIYELQTDDVIEISLGYKMEKVENAAIITERQNISNGTLIIIKLVGEELYLSVNSNHQLIMVPASSFDEKCIWVLQSNGNQKRPIQNNATGKYIDTSSNITTDTDKKLTFGGTDDAASIEELEYNEETSTFYANSDNPSRFQFFSITDISTSNSNISQEILEKINETETHPLTAIRRNQDVRLNLVFQ